MINKKLPYLINSSLFRTVSFPVNDAGFNL